MTEHIITAFEASWTEQKHQPGEDGSPEKVPDTLILHPLDGFEPRYECTCGEEFGSWSRVREHFKAVANGEWVPDDQLRLGDI